MKIDEIQQFHALPISYRIADQVGTGTLIVENGKASITASDSNDGIEGVEPIRLTEVQIAAIHHRDGVLTLEG